MAARKRPTPRERSISTAIQPKGGLAQMLGQAGGSEDIVSAAQQVESIPGGMELLYTMAAEGLMRKAGASKGDAKKIRLYRIGGAVERAYAKGGPARAAAEKTRGAGRGEDEMLVHMTEEELSIIKGMWGEPDINPNTGLPEYGFFSKIWKKVKKAVKSIVKSKIFQIVAPIALSMFAPGLGTWIGSTLGASGAAAPIIGNALIQGGLAEAGGGDFMKGAVSGAITGGLGAVAGEQVQKFANVSDRTAAVIGSSLAGGAASAVTGGEFVEGAIAGGLGEYMRPTTEALVAKGQDVFGIQDPAAGGILAEGIPPAPEYTIDPTAGAAEGLAPDVMGPPAPGPEPMGPPAPAVAPPAPTTGGAPAPAPGGALGQFGDLVMPALMGAGILGGGGAYEEGQMPELPPWMLESLPVYQMNRQFQGLPDPSLYYTYGQAGAPQSGQHLFMQPEPFAGEVGTPTVGPAGGLGGVGGLAGMIAAGHCKQQVIHRIPTRATGFHLSSDRWVRDLDRLMVVTSAEENMTTGRKMQTSHVSRPQLPLKGIMLKGEAPVGRMISRPD